MARAADRLREIDQTLPTNEDVFSADTPNDAYHALRDALPALANVVEAAHSYLRGSAGDPTREQLQAALARLDDDLEG